MWYLSDFFHFYLVYTIFPISFIYTLYFRLQLLHSLHIGPLGHYGCYFSDTFNSFGLIQVLIDASVYYFSDEFIVLIIFSDFFHISPGRHTVPISIRVTEPFRISLLPFLHLYSLLGFGCCFCILFSVQKCMLLYISVSTPVQINETWFVLIAGLIIVQAPLMTFTVGVWTMEFRGERVDYATIIHSFPVL